MSAETERNKEIVKEFFEIAFNRKKPAEAVKLHMGATYTQHNPMAKDGVEGFLAFAEWYTATFPQLNFAFKRCIAEGDYVVLHSHITTAPGERGTAVVDIFRMEGGKMVEHWDVLQEVPEKVENTNTMF